MASNEQSQYLTLTMSSQVLKRSDDFVTYDDGLFPRQTPIVRLPTIDNYTFHHSFEASTSREITPEKTAPDFATTKPIFSSSHRSTFVAPQPIPAIVLFNSRQDRHHYKPSLQRMVANLPVIVLPGLHNYQGTQWDREVEYSRVARMWKVLDWLSGLSNADEYETIDELGPREVEERAG